MDIGILWSIAIGIVAGWLAGQLWRGHGFGLLGNLLVGVVGAVVGGFLFNLLDLAAYGTWGLLVMSTIGAVIFLWIVSMMKRTA